MGCATSARVRVPRVKIMIWRLLDVDARSACPFIVQVGSIVQNCNWSLLPGSIEFDDSRVHAAVYRVSVAMILTSERVERCNLHYAKLCFARLNRLLSVRLGSGLLIDKWRGCEIIQNQLAIKIVNIGRGGFGEFFNSIS